jgi:hypothetical protein
MEQDFQEMPDITTTLARRGLEHDGSPIMLIKIETVCLEDVYSQ